MILEFLKGFVLSVLSHSEETLTLGALNSSHLFFFSNRLNLTSGIYLPTFTQNLHQPFIERFQTILWETNIAGWNIPIFNRKYIFNPGPFSIAMLDYRSVTPVTMDFPIGKSYCTCVCLQDQGTKDFSQLDISIGNF